MSRKCALGACIERKGVQHALNAKVHALDARARALNTKACVLNPRTEHACVDPRTRLC